MPRQNSAGSKRSKKVTGRKPAANGGRHQSLVGRVARSIRTRLKNLVG